MLAQLDNSTQVTIKVIATIIVFIPFIVRGIFFYIFRDNYLPHYFYIKDLNLFVKTENFNGNAKISFSNNKVSANDYILWQKGYDLEISIISPDTLIINRDYRFKNNNADKFQFIIVDNQIAENNDSDSKHKHLQNIDKVTEYRINVSYDLRNIDVRRCKDSVEIYNSKNKH